MSFHIDKCLFPSAGWKGNTEAQNYLLPKQNMPALFPD